MVDRQAQSERRSPGFTRRWFMRHAPELQFWGYEGGNILAAIAGAGGFAAFYSSVRLTLSEPNATFVSRAARLVAEFPDATATIGLGLIVLWSLGVGTLARRTGTPEASRWIDGIAVVAGLCLLAATLFFGANLITLSAVFFVSGSALLRQCRDYPVFLKLGGLLLAAGGLCLAGSGFRTLHADGTTLVAGLTALTGLYVAGAGLMTYEGGVFECAGARARKTKSIRSTFFGPFGPVDRFLETFVDRPVNTLVVSIVLPAIFWLPTETKTWAPFLTSMWARLPWRIMTAVAALSTGSAQGLTFAAANLCWSLGDVSIGSLDWERDKPSHDPAEVQSVRAQP